MRRAFPAAALLVAAAVAAGCSPAQNRAVQRDMEEAGRDIRRSVEKAGDEVRENAPRAKREIEEAAGSAADKAADLAQVAAATSAVKRAIMDDPALKDDANKIDVDTEDGVVYLTGHVVSESAKKQAERVAKAAQKEKKIAYSVKNELAIRPET